MDRNSEDQKDDIAGDGAIVIALARVRQALRGLRFGEVRIVVHEGTVVQVERTEKLRLPVAPPPRST